MEALREEVSLWESQTRLRQRRLAELEQQVLEKASRVETLSQQLEESKLHVGEMQRQLEESKCQQGEVEQQLSVRLRDCEEELARQAARTHQVKVRNRQKRSHFKHNPSLAPMLLNGPSQI